MAINTKAINNRIKSVKNTKKITGAMEMVAAAKMRKAVDSTLRTRAYAALANDIVRHLVKNNSESHALLSNNKAKKDLVIVISSNRGLCGSFNSKVISKFDKEIGVKYENKEQLEVIAVGKKAANHIKRLGYKIVSLYENLGDTPKFEDVLAISRNVTDSFLKGEYSKVEILYTNYISGLQQEVLVKQILPLTQESMDQMLEDIEQNEDEDFTLRVEDEYEMEPNPKALLAYVLPRIVEVQMFQAFLESAASEHSSRMVAMKNASESAGELIDELTLEFNKARQAAITQEIAEIVGAASAL